MRLAFVGLFLLACSNPPSPVDAGDNDTADPGPDVMTPVDVALDHGDPAACVPACAAGEVCAGGHCVTRDAGFDAALDVPASRDVVEDRALDAGPADVPSTAETFDLTVTYDDADYHARYLATCGATGCASVDESMVDVSHSSCAHTAGTTVTTFSVRVCATDGSGQCEDVHGSVSSHADAGAPSVTVTDAAGHHASADSIRVARGPTYLAGAPSLTRENFHVQFHVTPTATTPGADGIAGATTNPGYGDLWLLGCPAGR